MGSGQFRGECGSDPELGFWRGIGGFRGYGQTPTAPEDAATSRTCSNVARLGSGAAGAGDAGYVVAIVEAAIAEMDAGRIDAAKARLFALVAVVCGTRGQVGRRRSIGRGRAGPQRGGWWSGNARRCQSARTPAGRRGHGCHASSGAPATDAWRSIATSIGDTLERHGQVSAGRQGLRRVSPASDDGLHTFGASSGRTGEQGQAWEGAPPLTHHRSDLARR